LTNQRCFLLYFSYSVAFVYTVKKYKLNWKKRGCDAGGMRIIRNNKRKTINEQLSLLIFIFATSTKNQYVLDTSM
jgi:hypothetical protein